MRLLVLLFIYNVQVRGFFRFTDFDGRSSVKENDDVAGIERFSGYKESVSVTGRVFVTMFGYPSKCENMGRTHSCTLSFACWLVGGLSQDGCGANPWIVACCVTSQSSYSHISENILQNNIELREGSLPILQKRIDDFEDYEDGVKTCGLSPDRIFSKRIIGGKQANFGEFPWQAYIKIGTYQCGGVLVSTKFVATAAHCIIAAKLKDVLVYLGELDTQNTGKVKEFAPAELHRVKKRIIHPLFQFRATQPDRFDLALLELLTPTRQAAHILPICLPDFDLVLTGRKAVVAGWGKIQPSNELTGTNVLRSATVPILDIKECISWHKIKQIYVDLHDEMLCAGHKSGRHDACLGDSGGPLIVLDQGRWTLVGITSAGFGCGEPHQPGIYHKIPMTAQWIRSVVSSYEY